MYLGSILDQTCCFELVKMAAFMQLPRKQKELFRFHNENVAWMSEYFLGENTYPRAGALNNKQRMEVFLRHVGDPGFQTGVGEDMGIHQSTVSGTFVTIVEAIVAKADNWIQFPVDPADFHSGYQR